MITRLKRYALPLSLALNVFFAAVIAIHLVHRPPHHHGPHGLVEDIARALPPADAEIFRKTFLDNIPPNPPGPGEDFAGIAKALLAEPFDAAALEAAVREHQEDHRRFENALGGALVRAAGAMSAEGRRKLVEWHMTHRPPPGDGPPPPPPR